MILRVLIADDDPNVALYLKRVIEEVVDVNVIAIANDGKETIRQVEMYKPHAVFLDIEMPEINGVEAARELVEIQPGINFVFVTAHSDYALEAFELYSSDYILKPFDEQRLKKTVRRLKEKVCKEHESNLRQSQNILIQVKDRKVMIDPNEILFVESQNHKVRIKTQHGEYLTRSDLNILEQKLNPRLFFRCHKGYLVNLKKIKEIVPLDRTFEIIMRSGDKVLLSREREKVLREKFEIK